MSNVDVATVDGLVAELRAADEWSFPVRTMEELIAVGEAAVEPLAALVQEVRDDDYTRASITAAIVLGQLRAAAAAAALAEAMARSPRDALTFHVSAADALAEIGASALPALRSLAASDDDVDRMWAYYAAGLMSAPEAYDFLLGALAYDTAMLDGIACAFADHGNAAAIPALAAALERAEPRQREDIEQAIRELHDGETPPAAEHRDWRVRYRVNGVFGRFPPSWAVLMAIAHRHADFSARGGPPVRTLDEILADRRAERAVTCECCGVAKWPGSGVPVCPRMAATIPALQADLLRRRRDADGTDDIFEMLDDVDADLLEAATADEPRSRRGRERQEDRMTELRLAQRALIWAVEQGADSVGAARAMLLAEAARAAHEHGDPDGIFRPGPPPARPATPRAGRNDPCPCGSGRKYKKCCGPRDEARIDRTSAPSSAAPAGMPQLFTFDNEPVSFCRAHYDVTDHAAVLSALRRCPDLEADDDDVRFVWLRRIDEEEARSLGTIDVSRRDRLVLECMSRARLDRGKALLAALAGEWIVHRSDTEQDPAQAIAAARERGPRQIAEPVPPEVAGPVIRKVLDRQYRTWPDEPLPALGGRTAREAVRDAAGRRQVIELLRSFEEAELRRPAPLRYDFGWIWDDLGLAAERPAVR